MDKEVSDQTVQVHRSILVLAGRKCQKVPFLTRDGEFVCVEVLRPSQPNGVMSSAVILPNHTFTGQA